MKVFVSFSANLESPNTTILSNAVVDIDGPILGINDIADIERRIEAASKTKNLKVLHFVYLPDEPPPA